MDASETAKRIVGSKKKLTVKQVERLIQKTMDEARKKDRACMLGHGSISPKAVPLYF